MSTAKGGYIHTIGRRKTSVARVFLRPGKGQVTVNGKKHEDYFGRETSKMLGVAPLVLLNGLENFDVIVNVRGGGVTGQAGAMRHGLARALVELNPAHRADLRKAGFLTRDAREVERKKYGRHKARKRPQFSKR
jgi:small subunit ribosomal protein S9